MPKKDISRKKLVSKLDTIFSRYIRLKDADSNGNCSCFTCGNIYHWKKIQGGHFQSRRHYSTRWCELNVKTQCAKCNLFSQGEQYIFGIKLGKEVANKLYLQSKKTVKLSNIDLLEMIDDYSKKLKELV